MITGCRKEDLVSELTVRTHSVLSGLSPSLGGHDEGMDPHELLEAALTACTILTCQLYANRKKMDLVSTNVTVRILTEGAVTEISREVGFSGNLSEEEKARLFEIANKCPIHKILESTIKISSSRV